jgi:hypothetical protein
MLKPALLHGHAGKEKLARYSFHPIGPELRSVAGKSSGNRFYGQFGEVKDGWCSG